MSRSIGYVQNMDVVTLRNELYELQVNPLPVSNKDLNKDHSYDYLGYDGGDIIISARDNELTAKIGSIYYCSYLTSLDSYENRDIYTDTGMVTYVIKKDGLIYYKLSREQTFWCIGTSAMTSLVDPSDMMARATSYNLSIYVALFEEEGEVFELPNISYYNGVEGNFNLKVIRSKSGNISIIYYLDGWIKSIYKTENSQSASVNIKYYMNLGWDYLPVDGARLLINPEQISNQ